MARQSDAAKFNNATVRAKMAEGYRRMAAAMVTSESRDRLLQKAAKLEQELNAEALETDRLPEGSDAVTSTGKNHGRRQEQDRQA